MLRRTAILAPLMAAALSLLAAGPAVAQGGSGGGGTGGGGGGTTTTLSPDACVKITSFNPTAGYRPGGGSIGAVWLTYALQSCSSTPVEYLQAVTTETPADGGPVWTYTGGANLVPNQTSTQPTIDNDWAEIAMQYTVTLTVTDWTTGNVLATATKVISTPKPKNGIV